VPPAPVGHRHGQRQRTLVGTFGPVEIYLPRARLKTGDGGTKEWRSQGIERYQGRARQIEALIAGAYLSGTNTRRVKCAMGAFFKDAISKDGVSRAWRKVQTDWEVWSKLDLSNALILRLTLDGRWRGRGSTGHRPPYRW